MSDFLIKAAPTPVQAPAGPGNANAISQNDAVTRADEGAKADKENGAESPFAAVLKSRMDKKPAATEESEGASASATATQVDPLNAAIVIDLSTLLPFLVNQQTGAGDVAESSVSVEKSDADQNPLLGLQVSTEQEPTQGIASLPAASVSTSATAAQPAATGDALPSALATAANMNSRKQDTGTKEEAFTAAASAKFGETGRTSGKIAPDAAISADATLKSGEKNTPEAPANDFHALLERATTMTSAATQQANTSSSAPSLRVDTPMGQAGWRDEVGQKLTWMVGNNRQQADLVLNPPQLGRVEVSLTMNGDQATAIFTSSNPAVREALENSLHRLREVLADAGVSLGQTQVGSESPNQPSWKNEPDLGRNEGIGYASTVPLPEVAAAARTSAGRSMIDIFA